MEEIFAGWNREVFIQVGLILVFSLGFAWVARKVLEKMAQYKDMPDAYTSFVQAILAPLPWIIAIYGGLLAIETFMSTGVGFCFPPGFLPKVRNIFLVGTFSWLLLRWKNNYQTLFRKQVVNLLSRANDEAILIAVSKILSIVIFTVAGLMILDILEIQPTALLAFGGIGGLAVGWAGAPIVSNLLGGFMIHINRPFAIGDWIMSPNKSFEGVVEHIGWYMTRIRTFARRPTYIPNAMISDAIIENPAQMYNRRIKETVGLRYEDADKMEQVTQEIRQMLRSHPGIDQRQFLLVHFVSFGESALEIEVYTFTKTTKWEEWLTIQQDVFLKIIGIVEKNGAQIAYPTRRYINENEPTP